MLTGEYTPIIKSQIPKIKVILIMMYKKYFLFAGTKIIQKRSREKKRLIISLVTETSFSTIKGNLIRSILHPKKMDEKF